MSNTKYLAEISIVGLFLILGLTMNISAMPYISIGNTGHVFTVVPGQDADITLPIMVMNASDSSVKGLQFNVTFNCSKINITNITQVDIVNVPNAQPNQPIYNKLCNGSATYNGTSLLDLGIVKAFCFFRNTTLTSDNKTNASILFATVHNTTQPDICVLRIAFASHKELSENVTIGKIKMKVKAMPNYFNTNATLQMNITIEKMGRNNSVNGHVNVSNANIHSQARVDGGIRACRGDATKNGAIEVYDSLYIKEYKANLRILDNLDCLDVNNDGKVDIYDSLWIKEYKAGLRDINVY